MATTNKGYYYNQALVMPYGKTFPLIVEVVNEDGTPYDLTGFQAVYTNSLGLVRDCVILQNSINITFPPEETMVKNHNYDITVYSQSGETYGVCGGTVFVISPWV